MPTYIMINYKVCFCRDAIDRVLPAHGASQGEGDAIDRVLPAHGASQGEGDAINRVPTFKENVPVRRHVTYMGSIAAMEWL